MMLTIAIVLFICCFISYGLGVFYGVRDGKEEMIRRFTRYTVKTARKAPNGSVYSLN